MEEWGGRLDQKGQGARGSWEGGGGCVKRARRRDCGALMGIRGLGGGGGCLEAVRRGVEEPKGARVGRGEGVKDREGVVGGGAACERRVRCDV
jgi:hypothetical protein